MLKSSRHLGSLAFVFLVPLLFSFKAETALAGEVAALVSSGAALSEPADPVAAAIARREASRAKLGGVERSLLAAISQIYLERNYRPLFVGTDGFTPKARRLIKRLEAARYDGLDAADYADERFNLAGAATPSAAAEAEIALAHALLLYAHNARGGRVDIGRLRPNVFAKRPEFDAVDFLKAVASGADAVALLEAQNPPHRGFLALRRALGALIDKADAKDRATIDDIVINMERWRWLPRQLGASFVMVSVPEYLVRVIDKGAIAYQGRVIVGQKKTPTPLFSGEMQYVVVNPSWNVPPGILKNEILPLYRRDPAAVARLGLEVVRRAGGEVGFRQAPGERNALGRVKFMFPNDYSIYLHDTPSRALFSKATRALSHGCVRVDQPLKFADAVFSREDGFDGRQIEKLYGKGERYVRLKQRVPVHLTYFTVSSTPEGQLTHHADIYGLDAKMKQVMGL